MSFVMDTLGFHRYTHVISNWDSITVPLHILMSLTNFFCPVISANTFIRLTPSGYRGHPYLISNITCNTSSVFFSKISDKTLALGLRYKYTYTYIWIYVYTYIHMYMYLYTHLFNNIYYHVRNYATILIFIVFLS